MIFFQCLFPIRGGGNTSRAVIVPGTTIGLGDPPLVIRALYPVLYGIIADILYIILYRLPV